MQSESNQVLNINSKDGQKVSSQQSFPHPPPPAPTHEGGNSVTWT